MAIKIVKEPIMRFELEGIAKDGFGNIIKAVVDVEKEIMAIGGEFHSEEEVLLMEQENSQRENTWGINLQLDESDEGLIEFDSMINLKPVYGNRSREVDDGETRNKIRKIVKKLIHD